MSVAACAPPRPDYPVIGAKNFTEQVVLGELLAQHIEAKTGMKVERRFYLAGSYICNQALIAGRIDSYVEYTGHRADRHSQATGGQRSAACAGDGAAALPAARPGGGHRAAGI